MKKNMNYKSGFIIGFSLISIAILIGYIFEHDIAFIFAGLGTVIIGISILAIINKGNNKN